MSKQSPITFKQFQQKFQTEEACYKHLYEMKWPEGFQCPKCKHGACSIITTRTLPLYECKQCKHQTTVIVGTILEKTRTKLSTWLAALFLVSHDKRGISAKLIANELEICYQTAWSILHKIRHAMTERDADYMLSGLVELDDFYIGAPTENGKRGRGILKLLSAISNGLESKD